MPTYLVVGAGPVGSTTALKLAETGHRVIVATRSGNGPTHPQIEHRKVDASNERALTNASSGTSAILNCANPPYVSWDTDWPPIANAILGAAKQTGAGVVTMSNLYGYGPNHQLMRADDDARAPGNPVSVRGTLRGRRLRYDRTLRDPGHGPERNGAGHGRLVEGPPRLTRWCRRR